jgi:hypothetical protein
MRRNPHDLHVSFLAHQVRCAGELDQATRSRGLRCYGETGEEDPVMPIGGGVPVRLCERDVVRRSALTISNSALQREDLYPQMRGRQQEIEVVVCGRFDVPADPAEAVAGEAGRGPRIGLAEAASNCGRGIWEADDDLGALNCPPPSGVG